MNRNEALKMLRGGQRGIAEWNHRRREGEEIPDLVNANLIEADLSQANLSGACLVNAKMARAYLLSANMRKVDLRQADFGHATFDAVSVQGADLRGANLHGARLRTTDLCAADLREARVNYTDLGGANVLGADFTRAVFRGAVLAGMDLSNAKGLGEVKHLGPSDISTSTLIESKGRIPEAFLRGCGLTPWEVIAAKLYDPDLTACQVNDLQYKIFEARTTGPIVLGGVFVSYSHDDAKFVDKIRDKLGEKSVTVWLDRHDMVAGPLQEQVDRALCLNDAVLLVLSKSSVESDWVEYELETALKKEKEQKRAVLCPVALDASWEDKMGDVLWRQVKKKNVLDFAKWKTKAFDGQFQKLLKGLKIYYEKPDAKKSLPS